MWDTLFDRTGAVDISRYLECWEQMNIHQDPIILSHSTSTIPQIPFKIMRISTVGYSGSVGTRKVWILAKTPPIFHRKTWK